MPKTLFNHKQRIIGLQSAIIKSLNPGTIVQFKYKGDKIFDKKPLVLILWNDKSELPKIKLPKLKKATTPEGAPA